MAVKIRLTRMGDKKSPFYRVVAADSRCARNGKFIENLGTYDPLKKPFELKLNRERIEYWLGCGAVPTETARELLVKEGILKAKPYVAPKAKQMPPAKKEPKAEEPKAEEPAQAEAPAEADAQATDTAENA